MSEEIQHSPTSTHFQRFKLLLWKSYLWYRYYWWWTIIEILARCFAVLFVGLKMSSNSHLTTHLPTFAPIHSRLDLLDTITSHEYLAYSPSNKFTNQMMENIIARLTKENNLNNSIELVPLSNEHELAKYVVNRSIVKNQQSMGIVFCLNLRNHKTHYDVDNFTIPNVFSYEVRQSIAHDTRWLIEGDTTPGPYKKNSDYWVGGFAAIQLLINEEFIRMKLKNSSWSAPTNLFFQAFPYPQYETSEVERESLLSVVGIILIAAEVALSVPFITSIIIEKQKGVKNLMMIHHMGEILVLFSWFLKSFIVILISVTLMTVILKIPFKGHDTESVRYTNFSVLWTFFLLFGTANLCLILFLCAMFNSALIASLVHMLVHYFSFVLLVVSVKLNLKHTIHFFWPSPTIAIIEGIRFMVTAEVHGIPFNWTTAAELHDKESPVTFQLYCLVFVLQMIFYLLLAFFFDFVNPGEYGTQKSLFFIFSYLITGNKRKHASSSSNQVNVEQSIHSSDNTSSKFDEFSMEEIREPIKANHKPSLLIEDLRKKLDILHSLRDINLDFYENEISVLLGPKDSGKTTLFSILAGSVTFDYGNIIYKGTDVSDNLDLLQNDLGICFQEDRLFFYMTIVEHLMFFGMLKGLSQNDAAEEAEKFLVKIKMQDQQHFAVKNLSKVVKRKLCIAICLISNRKILLLDEPLEGLDYLSKMKIWNLLSDMRSDRTILISTSHAKEAEYLADRITILENGSVIAHGTPEFLKNKIGIHYEIIVSTNKEHFKDVTQEINSVVNATVQREMENEIVYRVPFSDLPSFPNLFENLEKRRQNFEITNINLTIDTIERVLMETGGLTSLSSVAPGSTTKILGSEYDREFADSAAGVRLRFRQFRILLRKKFLYAVKDSPHIFKRIILPSLIAVLLTRCIELVDFEPFVSKKMLPSMYVLHEEGFAAIRPRLMLFRRKLNESDDIYKAYSSYIQHSGGVVVEADYPTLTESLFNYARNDIMQFRRELLAAFVLSGSETSKITYNLRTIHALPIAIAVYSNLLLKSTLMDETTAIITINHPVPNVKQGCDSDELLIKALLILSVMYFSFTFLTMDLVLYLFEFSNKEVTSGLMYLQIMSGVPTWLYWLATFLFDFLFFSIVIAFRLALFILLNNYYTFFTLTHSFAYFLMILFLFGMSGLIYVYIFSFFYKPTKSSYYPRAFAFNFLCNVGVTMGHSFTLLPHFEEYSYLAHGFLSKLFSWMPFLNFPWAVLQYMSQWWHNHQCFILCSPLLLKWCTETKTLKQYLVFPTPHNMYAILLEIVFLTITFLCGVILFILMNSGFGDRVHNFFKNRKFSKEKTAEGEEIMREKEEIDYIKEDESRYHETALIADRLGKSYVQIFSLSSIVAVENVSFVAERGINFGILGGHDAGKTSTFHMMAGKVMPTTGEISVKGVRSVNWKQYHSLIGYCPQISPLLDKFTGRQMLQLIVALRGVKHVETIVDGWISVTGFEELQHIRCNLYSNSDKRILSTALALIGNPEVVLLDESTSGVDSATRRHLYDIIKQTKYSHKTVILASSSPIECELLCDRLTILTNGVMRCIGNLHDLKKRYNLGYFLMIKIHSEITSFRALVRLKKNILAMFKARNCRLLERYRSMLRYQIVDDALTLSALFRKMEEIKSKNPVIEEYRVTTTTIQDILESFSHPTNFFPSRNIFGSIHSSVDEYVKKKSGLGRGAK